jgi:hypothetical protein
VAASAGQSLGQLKDLLEETERDCLKLGLPLRAEVFSLLSLAVCPKGSVRQQSR